MRTTGEIQYSIPRTIPFASATASSIGTSLDRLNGWFRTNAIETLERRGFQGVELSLNLTGILDTFSSATLAFYLFLTERLFAFACFAHNSISHSMSSTASGEMPTNSTPIPTPFRQ